LAWLERDDFCQIYVAITIDQNGKKWTFCIAHSNHSRVGLKLFMWLSLLFENLGSFKMTRVLGEWWKCQPSGEKRQATGTATVRKYIPAQPGSRAGQALIDRFSHRKRRYLICSVSWRRLLSIYQMSRLPIYGSEKS
jgi:hypothetical protein